jgi:hypothetical protein
MSSLTTQAIKIAIDTENTLYSFVDSVKNIIENSSQSTKIANFATAANAIVRPLLVVSLLI